MLHHNKEQSGGEVLYLWDRRIELQSKGDYSSQKIRCNPSRDVLVEHLIIFPGTVISCYPLSLLRYTPASPHQNTATVPTQFLSINLSIVQSNY